MGIPLAHLVYVLKVTLFSLVLKNYGAITSLVRLVDVYNKSPRMFNPGEMRN